MKKYLLFLTTLFALVTVKLGAQPNTWSQVADFGGIERSYATGFTINGKAYVGTGLNGYNDIKDFWEYDPSTNVWTRKADFAGDARDAASSFSVNGKGYIGMGKSGLYPFVYYKDLWQYDPATDTWTRMADFPGIAKAYTTGFAIGNKGYIGGGYRYDYGPYSDFWEYDPATNAWTKKADFGGGPRSNPFGLSIGNKGYMGLGWNGSWYNDFYQYDPATNVWTKKANFGGTPREYTTGFAIADKGYIGTGYAGTAYNDFWQYDPAANVWTRKADFAGEARSGSVGFSIDDKGYIGTGNTGSVMYKDYWQYTPDGGGCIPPTNLFVSDITANSAIAHWTASTSTNVGYEIIYRALDSSLREIKFRSPTSGHVLLSGLSANTTYRWKIRTLCGGDKISSAWVTGADFTTTAGFAAAGNVIQATNNNLVNNLVVTPNPGNGNFILRVQLPYRMSSTMLYIYNSVGQKIWQENEGSVGGELNKTISLANYMHAGTYILTVQREDIKLSTKIVITE